MNFNSCTDIQRLDKRKSPKNIASVTVSGIWPSIRKNCSNDCKLLFIVCCSCKHWLIDQHTLSLNHNRWILSLELTFFFFFLQVCEFHSIFLLSFVLFFIQIWRFVHLTSILLHRFLKSLGKDEIGVLVGMVLMKWIHSLNILALIWWYFVRGASNLSRIG